MLREPLSKTCYKYAIGIACQSGKLLRESRNASYSTPHLYTKYNVANMNYWSLAKRAPPDERSFRIRDDNGYARQGAHCHGASLLSGHTGSPYIQVRLLPLIRRDPHRAYGLGQAPPARLRYLLQKMQSNLHCGQACPAWPPLQARHRMRHG